MIYFLVSVQQKYITRVHKKSIFFIEFFLICNFFDLCIKWNWLDHLYYLY